MKLKHNFVGSKMNTDIDERLLENGDYPFAENVRVVSSGASNMGIIENHLGARRCTTLNIDGARVIGSLSDGSNNKIYYFLTSPTVDMVLEWDDAAQTLNTVLESSNPNGILNFSKNYLITGINKITNGDSSRDLLIWTDDLNPPRMINIERAKTYTADGFIEDDISLIKRPPVYAPQISFTYTYSLLENNLLEKFLCFAYRYKYLDGEYSALSPFSYYQFSPSGFDLDYQTYENEGMVNAFNSLDISFNTGDERVTDVQIVFKESNSNTIYLIDTFNKSENGWGDNSTEVFTFSNNKVYTVLPEDELYRRYDNVPRLSKAQELVGNRICFANYLEQYNLVDVFNEDVILNYNISLNSYNYTGSELPITFTYASDPLLLNRIVVDLTGVALVKDSRITFDIDLRDFEHAGVYTVSIDYILGQDYNDVMDLVSDPDFIQFINTTLKNNFEANYTLTLPPDSIITSNSGFILIGSTATSFTLQAPVLNIQIDNTPLDTEDFDFTDEPSVWVYGANTKVFYKNSRTDSSLKTNRSYEVGVIYMDGHGRATPALTQNVNTIYIPQSLSTSQNKLVVTVNHKAPYWADRYRFVVKADPLAYQIIYSNIFYEEGLYRWIRLEGENKQKVSEGDTLIIKSDLTQVIPTIVKVKVLELGYKEENFLTGNFIDDTEDEEITEQAGVYMKIKLPIGIDINYRDDSFIVREGKARTRGSNAYAYVGGFSESDGAGGWVDMPITEGSSITIFLSNSKYGSSGGYESFKKTFIAGSSYANISDWYDAEVSNVSPFNTVQWLKGHVVPNPPFNPSFTADPAGQWYFEVKNVLNGNGQHPSYLQGTISIDKSVGLLVLETNPKDSGLNIFFEDSDTYMINGVNHEGNVQNQNASLGVPAIVELNMFNCFVMGNGVESYRVKDNFNSKFLNIDYRPTTTSIEKYREVRRYADLTYGAVYNENTNINGLNEFNLFTANFKEDLEKKYGAIQKIYSRDTDLVVFQEDKVSKVLFGKDALTKADGTNDVVTVGEVLGQQVPATGEWGMSSNPESFDFNGNALYFTDAKRGTPIRMANDGITEINKGMSNFFKDLFNASPFGKQIGAFDPYHNQYILSSGGEGVYPDTYIDCSNAISKSDVLGTFKVIIDYGIFTGTVGFNYETNGVPVLFDIVWGDEEYTTGYMGDAEYNDELTALGLGVVEELNTGLFTFSKTLALPTKAIVTVTCPIAGANVTISGLCAVKLPVIDVFMVTSNHSSYAGRHATQRYRWVKDDYISNYKEDKIIFETDGISAFTRVTGNQGQGFVPKNNSSILVESVSTYPEPSAFKEGGKFGYLFSDTLYDESDIETILDDATYMDTESTTYPNGDIKYNGEFKLPALFDKRYVYLVFDYRPAPVARDDSFSVEIGEDINYDLRVNDIDPDGNPLEVIIVTEPLYGTLVVEIDGTITYTSLGYEYTEDSFTYKVNNGTADSNIATVTIEITE